MAADDLLTQGAKASATMNYVEPHSLGPRMLRVNNASASL